MPSCQRRKIALVHYWLVSMRGGEKVLESFCRIFPEADIYTHVFDPNAVSERIRAHTVETTFIQRLPAARRLYKYYLPLMPMALERLDLSDYDLVISFESGPAKGVITRPDSLHVCYCHTPMRYLWDQQQSYAQKASPLTRSMMTLLSPSLRQWDVVSASRVDHFIANSQFVAKRIWKYFRREATVIHPPVSVNRFSVHDGPKDYYICLGQLVGYKRFDIAVEAFRRNGKPLIVGGTGEELPRLQAMAKDSPNIEFRGHIRPDELPALLQNSRALVFPGEEDFGIVPLEAMACGRPVIGFGSGGLMETVIDGVTGVFFTQPDTQSLAAAIERFEMEESRFSPDRIRDHAVQFDEALFETRVKAHLSSLLETSSKSDLLTSIAAPHLGEEPHLA